MSPRYEDITQDGRHILTAIMPGLGTVWRSFSESIEGLEGLIARGVVPILRRLVIVGRPGPFSVHVPISYEGEHRVMREAARDRLFVNMWLTARAPHAASFGPRPGKDASKEIIGEAFAEHVVTKPFAPAAERKVSAAEILALPGWSARAHDGYVFEEGEALIDRELQTVRTVTFGMMHTDSNQHVNSLVYPRMFEETVIERIAEDEGRPSAGLVARAVELRWRKPFFTGDRAEIRLARREDGGRRCLLRSR